MPDAGCFVLFANKHFCFAPGVTLKREGAKLNLVAAPSAQIRFTTLGSTSGTTTTQWIGDAGDKLDAKLAEFERKKWRADKKAKNQAEDAHTCPHCQRGFKWAALLKQHMASKHQK